VDVAQLVAVVAGGVLELPPLIVEMIAKTGEGPAAVEHEARAHPRFAVNRVGKVARLAAGRPVVSDVVICDLSAGGVGLVQPGWMAVGHEFVLVIPVIGARREEDAVIVQCRVVRCVPGAEGAASMVGATFLELLRANPPTAP
jgi:hypothetical protein